MDSLPVNNKTAGEAESTYNKTLETGAGATQVTLQSKKVLYYNIMTDHFLELRSCEARLRPPECIPRLCR